MATPVSNRGAGNKIVQQAVVKVLNQICEGDFAGFSYGFRLGRGAHDALEGPLPAEPVLRQVFEISDLRYHVNVRSTADFLITRGTRYSKTEDRYGDDLSTITEEYRHPDAILGWLSRHFGSPERKSGIRSGYMD